MDEIQGCSLFSGSMLMTEVVCPIGLHCPGGSAEPQQCAPGYYTNTTTEPDCYICPDG